MKYGKQYKMKFKSGCVQVMEIIKGNNKGETFNIIEKRVTKEKQTVNR